MKFIVVSFVILLSTTVYSQKRVVIKCAETKQPLAFATAECFEKSWGRYSDSNGVVVIPDSILSKGKIVFSYVGYEPFSIAGKSANEVFLSPLSIRLNDVSVKNCKAYKTEKIEVRNKKANFMLGFNGKSNGQMWAVYVPNYTVKRGLLQTLSFGAYAFHKESKLDAPIRIRLFELDTVSRLPGEEITAEIITLTPGKAKWLTFHLKEYQLQIPSNGVVVAFEMFDAGPQFHYKTVLDFGDRKEERQMYGWSILAIRKEKVVGFARSPGGRWSVFKNKDKLQDAPQVSLGIKVCKE